MAKKKHRAVQAQQAASGAAVPAFSPAKSPYFEKTIQTLGRRALFVDTGAIVGCMDAEDEAFPAFFDELIGEKLVTSTYVLAECVRRIIKAQRPDQFVGPAGQRNVQLALHILTDWLTERNVHVLSVPEDVFEQAKRSLQKHQGLKCDLTDILSYEIIQGLQENRIVAKDTHFKSLGLDVLP